MAFKDPVVAGEDLIYNGIRSPNYVQGSAGWRVGKDGSTQLGNTLFVGDVGSTGQISADSFQVGPNGLWLPDGTNVANRLANLEAQTPGSYDNPTPGEAMFALQVPYSTLSTTSPSTTTEIGLVECDTGWFPNTGWYRMEMDPILFHNSAATLSTTFMRVRLEQTSDGVTVPAAPTVASSINGLYGWVNNATTGFYSIKGSWTRYLTVPYRYRMLITYGISGGPTVSINNDGTYVGMVFYYLGNVPNSTTATGGFGSGFNPTTGGSSPPPTPPPTPKTYTKTWFTTWSGSYDGNNNLRLGDTNTPYLYQGYYSGTHGNTRSMAGFNSADIVSTLSGATIVSGTLGICPAHTWYNSGATFVVGAHNQSAKPSTFTGTSTGSINGGTNIVSGHHQVFNLNGTQLANFASGAWKGIVLGPAPSNSLQYYGYCYGVGQAGDPYLTITYKK